MTRTIPITNEHEVEGTATLVIHLPIRVSADFRLYLKQKPNRQGNIVIDTGVVRKILQAHLDAGGFHTDVESFDVCDIIAVNGIEGAFQLQEAIYGYLGDMPEGKDADKVKIEKIELS